MGLNGTGTEIEGGGANTVTVASLLNGTLLFNELLPVRNRGENVVALYLRFGKRKKYHSYMYAFDF